MPVPSRPLPHVGDRARIAHFGGSFEDAVIVAVREQGRCLEARGENGRLLEFRLSPATARFVSGGTGGPRLELLGES